MSNTKREMACRVLAVIGLGLCNALLVTAQSRPLTTPDSTNDEKNLAQVSQGFGRMEDEMRARREVRYAEKQHRENVERAREVAELGVQLRDSYKLKHSLGREGLKKLERLEKLAKRVRSEAGGSDDDVRLDNPPGGVESTLTRLAELSESLHKSVAETPRQVISAAVIDQANVILELTRHARNLLQR